MDLDHFLEPFIIDDSKLSTLTVKFSKIYKHLALNALDQFLATPVNVLPNGHEKGRILALDFGGTNLRVGLIELCGLTDGIDPAIRLQHEKSWPIGDHLKMEKAEDLFLWVGDCIAEVVTDCLHLLNPQPSPTDPTIDVVPIGITFSFPMIQTSIREATLMQMGKGFAITTNLNLGKLVLSGYSRHTDPSYSTPKLPYIEITAITNDTVATLASLAYVVQARSSDRVAMGLIVGTGVNATIPLRLLDLHWTKRAALRLPTSVDSSMSTTIVNTEWTIKGAAPPLHELGLITKWDEELDRCTEVPGFQPFEYMVAGRYLGELARLVIVDYLEHSLCIASSDLPTTLLSKGAITTTYLSQVVAKTVSSTELAHQLNAQFPSSTWKWTEDTATVVQKVSNIIKQRSAALVAAASVGLLVCADQLSLRDQIKSHVHGFNQNFWGAEHGDNILIAYTGGTISHFPDYLSVCQAKIDYLVNDLTTLQGTGKKVVLEEAKAGGIIGAGVLAGTVWNLPRRGSETYSVPPTFDNSTLAPG